MSNDEMSELFSKTVEIRRRLDQLAESSTVALSRSEGFDARVGDSIQLFSTVVRNLEIAINLWDQSKQAVVVADSLIPKVETLTTRLVISADEVRKSHAVVKSNLGTLETRLASVETLSVNIERQLKENAKAVSSLMSSIERLTSRVATIEASVDDLTDMVKLPVRKRRATRPQTEADISDVS